MLDNRIWLSSYQSQLLLKTQTKFRQINEAGFGGKFWKVLFGGGLFVGIDFSLCVPSDVFPSDTREEDDGRFVLIEHRIGFVRESDLFVQIFIPELKWDGGQFRLFPHPWPHWIKILSGNRSIHPCPRDPYPPYFATAREISASGLQSRDEINRAVLAYVRALPAEKKIIFLYG